MGGGGAAGLGLLVASLPKMPFVLAGGLASVHLVSPDLQVLGLGQRASAGHPECHRAGVGAGSGSAAPG